MKKLKNSFFARNPDMVAKELLGKTIVRKINGRTLKARIVETEAYFGEDDPASRASKGKNKVSEMMWSHPGRIMIYNVHKYLMFNVVTGDFRKPSAVLIRALEPLNFKARCNGPGLLTNALKINKDLHGLSITNNKNIKLIDNGFDEKYEIGKSFRIGVTKDLSKHFRFFIKNNEFISRK